MAPAKKDGKYGWEISRQRLVADLLGKFPPLFTLSRSQSRLAWFASMCMPRQSVKKNFDCFSNLARLQLRLGNLHRLW